MLIARHESLRTSYLPGERPRQRVAASGVQMLEVCSLGEGQWGPMDRSAVAEALVRWLCESLDPVRRPVRIAVAIAPGPGDRVIACAARFTHLAVDNGAIEILKRDFAGLLGDPARRPAGPPGHQPLDQAELEATPTERHRTDAALDYQRERSRRIPRYLYALPGARATGESLAVELSSAAAAIAVRQVAARTRTSRSSIVLAAVCAVVARHDNYPELVFPMVSSNRFERHLANYVGTLAQASLATIEIGGRSFDELVRHTWTGVLEASRHAQVRHGQAGRHERTDRERTGAAPQLRPVVQQPRSRIVVRAHRGRRVPARGDRHRGRPDRAALAPDAGHQHKRGNAGPVPPQPDRPLPAAGRVERPVAAGGTGVGAAGGRAPAGGRRHGDVPAARMPGLIGLEPIAGTPDRILVDHCWVDVADVQRLLDEAVAPAVARVFASAGGRPLVAHLAATDAVRTPQQAHDRCMAIVRRHPTAITPRHYVICPTAPPDPADPAAWPPPLAAGTGR